MNIVELFIAQAHKSPHKVALVENNKSITYSALYTSVKKTANYFQSKNVSQGDKTLIAVPMSIDTYRVVLALLYLGAIPVFMEEWAFKNNFYNNAKTLDCKAVIVARKFRFIALLSKAIRQIPIKLSLSKLGNSDGECCSLKPNNPALYSFTSGSSGEAKIAVRSHAFLKEQFRILSEVTNCRGDENIYCGLAVVVLFYLGQGNTIVLRTKKLQNKAVLLNSNLNKFHVNQIVDSPAKILHYSTKITVESASKITDIYTGGGPVFPNDAKNLNSVFFNAKCTVIYGSTEVEPISVVNSNQIIEANNNHEKGLCVGKVSDNLSLKIIALETSQDEILNLEDFQNKWLQDQKIGEVVVMGSHVLDSYYKSQDLFKKQKIKVEGNLWHKTGDSGYIKNDLLYLTGPCHYLIKKGDKLISPFIFENNVRQISGVNKGTIIDNNGKLTVVLESSISASSLSEQLKNIINYDALLILKKIPMDVRHQTKINYRELKILLNNNVH